MMQLWTKALGSTERRPGDYASLVQGHRSGTSPSAIASAATRTGRVVPASPASPSGPFTRFEDHISTFEMIELLDCEVIPSRHLTVNGHLTFE